MPPNMGPPFPTCVVHKSFPRLSGSNPYMVPDFEVATRTCFPFGNVRSATELPKSKSSPGISAQAGLLGQPGIQLSPATGWLDHNKLPLSKSKARTASEVGRSIAEKELPVVA